MIKIAGILLLTLLSSCTLAPTKKELPKSSVRAPEEGTCYVSWKDQATKDLYKKGFGLTHEEKEDNGLLFSALSNQIVYVYDKIENTYLVRFEVTDKNGYKLA